MFFSYFPDILVTCYKISNIYSQHIQVSTWLVCFFYILTSFSVSITGGSFRGYAVKSTTSSGKKTGEFFPMQSTGQKFMCTDSKSSVTHKIAKEKNRLNVDWKFDDAKQRDTKFRCFLMNFHFISPDELWWWFTDLQSYHFKGSVYLLDGRWIKNIFGVQLTYALFWTFPVLAFCAVIFLSTLIGVASRFSELNLRKNYR